MTSPSQTAPALDRVRAGALCAGCGACAALAPGGVEMAVSEAGFLRPRQTGPVDAGADAAIAAACPGLGQTVADGGRTDHPLWGPYLAMKTGWAADPDLRFKGSSGGALSALLAWLIEAGEVTGALTNGADPDRAAANRPRLVRSRAEVAEAAGSRYAPSAPLAALGLAAGEGPFAFVGKPCDAAALRAMQARDPSLAARFPVVLSFFCAGVPALSGGEAVIRALGFDPAAVAAFRYRGHGWPGRAVARTASGEEAAMSYHESWGGILAPRVQHRCKLCADGTGVAADIVCADAWETDAEGYPLFEEAPGVSLIVARTEKGAALLARAEAAGALLTETFDPAPLAAMQPGQTRRRQALAARLLGQRLLGRPAPRYRGLGLWRAARTGSLRWSLRNLAGMLRRGIRGRPE